MESFGFLVLSDVSEAVRYWKEIPLQELVREVSERIEVKEKEESERYGRYLQESRSEEIQRRLSLIQEFEEIGIDGNDPGILYLKDLMHRQFEEETGQGTAIGMQAPHLNGLREISSDWKTLAGRFDPTYTLQHLFAEKGSESFAKPIAQYFDQMIELHSCWMGPPFPCGKMQYGPLPNLAQNLKRRLLLVASAEDKQDTSTDLYRLTAMPLRLPESETASNFYLLDKETCRENYLPLEETELRRILEPQGNLPPEIEETADLVRSVQYMLQLSEGHPDWDLLLTCFQEE